MNEFYPTPPSLALKMAQTFDNKNVRRLLEPSAGRGALTEACEQVLSKYPQYDIDCVEIDLDNQAILRSKHYSVVGMDFMEFSGHALYSHVIMNPIFSQGVEHVLKAWDLLYDGELVAVINAESLRNLCTANRKLLTNIIADNNGTVEYLQEMFLSPDTERKSKVEIALIHLTKRAEFNFNLEDALSGLEEDTPPVLEQEQRHDLALKESAIANHVRVFNVAVAHLKEACVANEKAAYYRRLIGESRNFYRPDDLHVGAAAITHSFNEGYHQLKKQAWDVVLSSTEFSKHLSSKVYDELRSQFEQVAKLEFTEANIRGFLIGLLEQKNGYDTQMLLDVFDEISKYHYDNRVFYRGWKSNDKHRTAAYRIKMTRFILPDAKFRTWGKGVDWGFQRKMADFDRAFAMLAGDYLPFKPLASVLNDYTISGERYKSSYFDVRFYSGAGTVHFYPTRKDLIDRLNRIVGAVRRWLPNEGDNVPPVFWEQYNKAEKINEVMGVTFNRWNEPSVEDIEVIHLKACEKLKINIGCLLAHEPDNAGMLPESLESAEAA